jgi:hypothetical protein
LRLGRSVARRQQLMSISTLPTWRDCWPPSCHVTRPALSWRVAGQLAPGER